MRHSDYTIGNRWGHDYVQNNVTGHVTWINSVENIQFTGDNSTPEIDTDAMISAGYTLNADGEWTTEDTSDAIAEDTTAGTPEDTNYTAVAEDTTAEDTQVATSEDTTDEQTIDAVDEQTTAEDTNGSEDTTDEQTTDASSRRYNSRRYK